MRILLIDDNIDIGELLCFNFSLAGHVAQHLASGDAAVQALEQTPEAFDVIIVDYHMPGMDGFDVVRRLRQSSKQRLQSIPIIILTGHDGREMKNRAQEAGVARVVCKPIVPDHLLEIVSSVVNDQRDNPM
jgi:two-component system response regulator TctD